MFIFQLYVPSGQTHTQLQMLLCAAALKCKCVAWRWKHPAWKESCPQLFKHRLYSEDWTSSRLKAPLATELWNELNKNRKAALLSLLPFNTFKDVRFYEVTDSIFFIFCRNISFINCFLDAWRWSTNLAIKKNSFDMMNNSREQHLFQLTCRQVNIIWRQT